jgi:predicted O-methyltransferase YrrM
MREKLQSLYARKPKLTPAYIREVLGLHDGRAERVAEISGGISKDEAAMLGEVVAELKPIRTLEVGLGYGFSAIAICDAADREAAERKHIVIDPHQSKYWNGAGLRNLVETGHGDCIEFHEEPSYRVLPRVVEVGTEIDFAFIVGWHTFDYVFVDFIYIDKMLRRGGVVAFDDADWPSIRPIIRYVVTNLSYQVLRTLPEKKPREQIDIDLGIEGSCIALRKVAAQHQRDIFFHRSFG